MRAIGKRRTRDVIAKVALPGDLPQLVSPGESPSPADTAVSRSLGNLQDAVNSLIDLVGDLDLGTL